jgi:hypothetical protein
MRSFASTSMKMAFGGGFSVVNVRDRHLGKHDTEKPWDAGR